MPLVWGRARTTSPWGRRRLGWLGGSHCPALHPTARMGVGVAGGASVAV